MDNYDAIISAYDVLTKSIDTILDSANQIKNIVNKLDNNQHWDGNGFKAYNEKMNNLSTNFSAFCSDIYSLNSVMKKSAENYKAVDQKVSF